MDESSEESELPPEEGGDLFGQGGEQSGGQAGPSPVHGSFRIDHHTARLPKSVGNGEFANAMMVAAGATEFILDFVQRLSEPARVVTRVVLSPVVAGQYVQAMRHNIGMYEQNFGPLPMLPRPRSGGQLGEPPSQPAGDETAGSPLPSKTDAAASVSQTGGGGDAVPPGGSAGGSSAGGSSAGGGSAGGGSAGGGSAAGGEGGGMAGIAGAGFPVPPSVPSPRAIEDIYDDLRIDDEMLAGRYANAVVVRHTPAEFAFEFIARFVPASVVSARVIVAAANVPSLVASLEQALGDHQRRSGPFGRGGPPQPSEN